MHLYYFQTFSPGNSLDLLATTKVKFFSQRFCKRINLSLISIITLQRSNDLKFCAEILQQKCKVHQKSLLTLTLKLPCIKVPYFSTKTLETMEQIVTDYNFGYSWTNGINYKTDLKSYQNTSNALWHNAFSL